MNDESAARPEPVRASRFGLSGKLLLLTILFVMIAEVLIYVPLVANYRVTWLNDRLSAAYTAALELDVPTGSQRVPEDLARRILKSIGARAVAMKMGESRRLLAASDVIPQVTDDFDMRDVGTFTSIVDAFKTMLATKKNDVMRVVGPAPIGGEFVEIVIEEAPLRRAMVRFSSNILLLSLVISIMGFAGGMTMSAIKRDRGVKDYGTLVVGHGGVLDRIDSICFAAPVFFHLTRYYFTPAVVP